MGVTQLIPVHNCASCQTSEQLFQEVYTELRRFAAARLRREAPGQTLQPTALVHEAYLRLVNGYAERRWHNRAEFFAAAAETMRRIVIENCRRKKRVKRGGSFDRLNIDLDNFASQSQAFDILSIDEALRALEDVDEQKALLVKLRYFSSMTMQEAAELLEVSVPTAERYWRYARAFLGAQLKVAERQQKPLSRPK